MTKRRPNYYKVISGRTRFYADEDVNMAIILWLRSRGYHVDAAVDFGFSGRDDAFHLSEASRRKAVLLTSDRDFLDDRKFSFSALKNTAIVVMATEWNNDSQLNFGYMLLALEREIAKSGTKNLQGLKIELRGPRMLLRARVGGKIHRDELDVSKPFNTRNLFAE